MSRKDPQGRPTIGALAGWQFAWTATPLSYLEPVYAGISRGARDLGCNLLLGCGMGSWSGKSDLLRPAWPFSSPESDFVPIGPWNTDGLIAVNPLHSPARSQYVQDLRAAGHPVVFVASGEPGPTIVADNRSGVLEAMEHLADHGHRCIAFIAGSVEDMEGDSGERLCAYHDAVERYGLSADPRLVAWSDHLYDGGYRAMRKILASGVPLTAVLASNDESALGAMQALREDGRRIPHDVAIIGFDDRPESAVQEPALSSVRISLHQIGYRAVESLYRFLTGQAETIEAARVATRLVARESCGCGPNTPRPTAPVIAAPESEKPEPMATSEQLAKAMTAAVLAGAQGLPSDEVEALCQRLASAFDASVERRDASRFRAALDAVVRRATASGDDLQTWQAALSNLGATLDELPAASRGLAAELLAQAQLTISVSVYRHLSRHVVDQRWMLNRLGTLTARLLAALDEAQIYQVLAQHLPAMGVHIAWLALMDAREEAADHRTALRVILPKERGGDPSTLHFPSHEFPPRSLLPDDEAYSLALFPLTGPRGQFGYVVFDTSDLHLYGAVAQQLATALNSADLYREATEGRRLAEEANALKSRFLSTVSHELRTPLSLIVGLSEILLQESDEVGSSLPELYRNDVQQIHANAQHLAGLLGDVLELAKGDAGQLNLANEYVDLSEALRLVAETGRQLAYDKGLEWHADLSSDGSWVWGDRTRLRQVALNLVNNAIKFTAQGYVSLTLETGPDSVTVTVRDTGLGIPPEEQTAIFDEFRRSERSAGRGYGGLGLGLAICKRLVELHGGAIGVRSSGEEGAGSTFWFSLPTAQPPASQVQRSALVARAQRDIVVLSHQAASSRRLHEHLSRRGFNVQTVLMDETPDWLSQLTTSPPGAVVVDVSAAPQQGWNVLRAIKSQPGMQSLPVLFCSLSSDGGSVMELTYLTKPIGMVDLTQALDQHWLTSEAGDNTRVILIVDDDPATLKMHARIVQDHLPSYQVRPARNGLEALNILQQEQVDLVLLDLMMPELDGFGVLETMHENEGTRQIPVIVLTGQVLTEEDMVRLNRGVQTVLSKGMFSLEETLAHLDTALERSRQLSDEAQRLVRQAMAYIHTHYHEPISRADLARHVALSEDYLTSCFREELGVTPIAYINRYRVNQAKRLLIESGKSITEIALDVGFSDSGYFSRVFRREVGLSPDAYRKA